MLQVATLIDHIIVSGSRFLISILIARFLGLEGFGIYALLWTIVTFASSVQIPITITPMMQLGPRVPERRLEQFYTTGLFVQLAYTLAIIPIVTAAALPIIWGRQDAVWLILSLNLYIAAFNQYEFFRRYFYANGNWYAALIFDVLLYVILLGLIFGFVSYGKLSIAAYLAMSAAPATVLCLVIVWIYPFGRGRGIVHGAQIRQIGKIARPLLISTIAGFISGHLFIYATAAFLGPTDVGGIAAARNILGPLVILMMALENEMTRHAVLKHKDSAESLASFARKTTLIWLSGFAGYVIVVSWFADPLLELVYGDDFGRFESLVYWLGGASLIQIVTRVQAIRLRTEGEYNTIKAANLAAMWVAVLLSVPLVYLFGLTGAMVIVIAQQSTILYFQYVPLQLDPHLEVLPWKLRSH